MTIRTDIEREGKLKDGYIRVAAMTPKIKVADCEYNIDNIKTLMRVRLIRKILL